MFEPLLAPLPPVVPFEVPVEPAVDPVETPTESVVPLFEPPELPELALELSKPPLELPEPPLAPPEPPLAPAEPPFELVALVELVVPVEPALEAVPSVPCESLGAGSLELEQAARTRPHTRKSVRCIGAPRAVAVTHPLKPPRFDYSRSSLELISRPTHPGGSGRKLASVELAEREAAREERQKQLLISQIQRLISGNLGGCRWGPACRGHGML
jgi:hypothetical protein